jgi:hypothetical protein
MKNWFHMLQNFRLDVLQVDVEFLDLEGGKGCIFTKRCIMAEAGSKTNTNLYSD